MLKFIDMGILIFNYKKLHDFVFLHLLWIVSVDSVVNSCLLVRAMDYQVKPCHFVTLLILVKMLLLCAWLCERKINVE